MVVVALRLRLRWLLPGGLALPLLAAAASAGGAHGFAAVHAAVAVAVGAAAAPHVVALMLVMLPALLMALVAGLPGMLLMLGVALVLLRRSGLRGGGRGERKRDRGNENLHLKSPEAFDGLEGSKLQVVRGGGGSDSGLRPRMKSTRGSG